VIELARRIVVGRHVAGLLDARGPWLIVGAMDFLRCSSHKIDSSMRGQMRP
jgi:hypothetical protein